MEYSEKSCPDRDRRGRALASQTSYNSSGLSWKRSAVAHMRLSGLANAGPVDAVAFHHFEQLMIVGVVNVEVFDSHGPPEAMATVSIATVPMR